jgi:hypothetical protein
LDQTIDSDRIDELLQFLPRFERPGRSYVRSWAGGEETPDGALTMPFPIYEEDVASFYWLAGQTWWSDFDYEPRHAYRMLQDDGFVEGCSLDDIRTMLTYCVRGERFSDGHWAHMLENGRIVALLRRLAVLRKELPGSTAVAREQR